MSHTDKDCPYWVKTNDPTLPRHENHNHYWLGRSYTRRRHARDERGRYLYDLKVEQVRVVKDNMDWYLSWQGKTATGNYSPGCGRDAARFYRYETREHWEPVYEEYTVTSADHCTIDEPNTPTYARRDQPCAMALDYWYFNPFGGGPSRYERGEFNAASRRSTRDTLRGYMKEVNAADNWDDLDDSQIPHDRHRHTIIWW